MIYSNPSFETEKHTHAFGAMLWWAVSLISMFTGGRRYRYRSVRCFGA